VFELIVSEAIRQEYERALNEPRFGERYGLIRQDIEDFLELVDRTAVMVTPSRSLPIQVRDKTDEKVRAAALGGKADYLVSGDQDLLVLRDDPGLGQLKIVTVREFLDILRPLK